MYNEKGKTKRKLPGAAARMPDGAARALPVPAGLRGGGSGGCCGAAHPPAVSLLPRAREIGDMAGGGGEEGGKDAGPRQRGSLRAAGGAEAAPAEGRGTSAGAQPGPRGAGGRTGPVVRREQYKSTPTEQTRIDQIISDIIIGFN